VIALQSATWDKASAAGAITQNSTPVRVLEMVRAAAAATSKAIVVATDLLVLVVWSARMIVTIVMLLAMMIDAVAEYVRMRDASSILWSFLIEAKMTSVYVLKWLRVSYDYSVRSRVDSATLVLVA
jgi:hypothetical protein